MITIALLLSAAQPLPLHPAILSPGQAEWRTFIMAAVAAPRQPKRLHGLDQLVGGLRAEPLYVVRDRTGPSGL
jgi:hypothetical protein